MRIRFNKTLIIFLLIMSLFTISLLIKETYQKDKPETHPVNYINQFGSLSHYNWSADGKFISYCVNDNQTTKAYIMNWENKMSTEIGNGYDLKWRPYN